MGPTGNTQPKPRSSGMDFLQSASNAIAGNVAGPVDLIGAGLRGVGLPIPQNPVGGSQWMAEKGLTREVPMGPARIAGETFGMAGPAVAAANTTKIAQALNQVQRNAVSPRTIYGPSARQRGMIIADDDGIPELFHHGTSREFDTFDHKYGGSVWDDAASRAGFFFTKDKSEARHFAEAAASTVGGKPTIVSAHIDANRLASIGPDDLSRHTDRWLRSLPDDEREMQLATRAYDAVDGGISKGLELAILDAKSRGFDAARIALDDGTNWVVTFKGDAIKRVK